MNIKCLFHYSFAGQPETRIHSEAVSHGAVFSGGNGLRQRRHRRRLRNEDPEPSKRSQTVQGPMQVDDQGERDAEEQRGGDERM